MAQSLDFLAELNYNNSMKAGHSGIHFRKGISRNQTGLPQMAAATVLYEPVHRSYGGGSGDIREHYPYRRGQG